MSFTDAQKTDIRRYCGYSAFGSGNTGFSSWRFMVAYGDLEFKMNNLSPSEEAVVTTYLTNLSTLEAAIPASGANLDIGEAAVYKRNQNETRDRKRLYDTWRRELCNFFGIPPGDGLRGGGSIAMVV